MIIAKNSLAFASRCRGRGTAKPHHLRCPIAGAGAFGCEFKRAPPSLPTGVGGVSEVDEVGFASNFYKCEGFIESQAKCAVLLSFLGFDPPVAELAGSGDLPGQPLRRPLWGLPMGKRIRRAVVIPLQTFMIKAVAHL